MPPIGRQLGKEIRRIVTVTRPERFDYRAFLAKHGGGTVMKCGAKQIIYAQGDSADALFYIASGSVKVMIVSEFGKEAVIGILGPGDFLGEGGLDGRPSQNSTITTTAESEIVRLDRTVVMRALRDDAEFARIFLAFLLQRNQKLQADLPDQLFDSSEKRLARILLTLAPPRWYAVQHHQHVDQSRDAGCHGRHHTLAHQSVHEQVSQARLHRLQR